MFGKKKKKQKQKPEVFVSLEANGVSIEAINFATTKDSDGNPIVNVVTKDVCPALHYDTVDFVMKTTTKQINVSARFRGARDEKKFKVYTFDLDDYNQYYI